MGEKRSRAEKMTGRLEKLKSYLQGYQYSLRTLMKSFPAGLLEGRAPFASVGKYVVWPCSDAALVLIYPSEQRSIEVEIREPLSVDHGHFLAHSDEGLFYGIDGQPATWRAAVRIENATKYFVQMADPMSNGALGYFAPRFRKLIVCGWDCVLPQPDDQAILDLRSDVSSQNFSPDSHTPRSAALERALKLLSEYRSLLDSEGEREEALQTFLASHPALLYPDFVSCMPKFKLGSEFVTDFVVLTYGASGPEHVFVEIERPGKAVTTNKGQVTSHFTQAQDQLIRWSYWIRDNRAYLLSRLPGLETPVFHLVMGRVPSEAALARRTVAGSLGLSGSRFSFYDDLADRYERIVRSLLE